MSVSVSVSFYRDDFSVLQKVNPSSDARICFSFEHSVPLKAMSFESIVSLVLYNAMQFCAFGH